MDLPSYFSWLHGIEGQSGTCREDMADFCLLLVKIATLY